MTITVVLSEPTLFMVPFSGGPALPPYAELARYACSTSNLMSWRSKIVIGKFDRHRAVDIYSFRTARSRDRAVRGHRIHARRQVILRNFDSLYENLVDLLCLAAQNAGGERFEQRYVILRRSMIAAYRVLRSRMCADVLPGAMARFPFDLLLAVETLDPLITDLNTMDLMIECRAALDSAHQSMNADTHCQ